MASRLFLAVLTLAACTSFEGAAPSPDPGPAGGSPACTPGQQISCTCLDQRKAIQQCLPDGSAYGTCGPCGGGQGGGGSGGGLYGGSGQGGDAGASMGGAGAGGEGGAGAGVGGEGGAGNGGAGGETPDPCVAAGALAPGARWAIEGGTMARCNRSSLEGPSSEATSMALELEDENQGKKFSPQLVVDEEGIPYFQQSNRIFALHRPKGGAGEVREVYAGTSPSTATLLLLPEQRGLRTVVGTDQVTVALVPLVRQGESWTIEEVKTIKAGSAVGFIGLSMQGPEEVLLSINSTAYSFEYPSLKQKPAFATDLMHMLPARDVLQGSTYVCREEGGKVLLEQSGGPTQGLFELPLLNGKSCHVAVGPGGRVYVTSGAAACSLDPANAEFDRPSFSTTVGAEALAPAVRKDGSAVVVFNQESSSVLWSVSAGMELQWKNAFKITEQVLAPPLLDAQGNVYVCTDQQVLSLSPAGKIRWQRGHEQKTPQCALVLSAPGRLDVMTDRYWFRVEAT